jgi:hypothetical protein
MLDNAGLSANRQTCPAEAFFSPLRDVYPASMGTPGPGRDPLVQRDSAAVRRRRRRRRIRHGMLWLLTVVTTGVLVVIALFVKEISREPGVVRPAALSAKTLPAKTGPVTSRPASAAPHVSKGQPSPAASQPQVTDVASGLGYQLLAEPWRRDCPSTLNTPMFSWTAGENAVAGHVVIDGSTITWHGNACSGVLQQQFSYAGPAYLQATATSLLGALDPAYYAGVQHYISMQASSGIQVSGHQAWQIRFTVNYPGGTSQGMTWSSELGAVVVVDRGTGQEPAVFYVSVPVNLGTGEVSTLVSSLQLS